MNLQPDMCKESPCVIEFSIGSLLSEIGEPSKKGEGILQESEEIQDTRIWPSKTTKQGTHGLTETEMTSMEPARVCTRSSMQCGVFVGLLTGYKCISFSPFESGFLSHSCPGTVSVDQTASQVLGLRGCTTLPGCVSDSCACFWHSFPLTGLPRFSFCPVQLSSIGSLVFSEEETDGEWIWERGEVGRN